MAREGKRVSHRPVIVKVAELVRKSLHMIRLEPRSVADHVKVSGCDSSLPNTLTDNEVVVPE